MTRAYAFFLQDEQKLFLVAGSKIIEHLILSRIGEEGLGLWQAISIRANTIWTPADQEATSHSHAQGP